MIGCYSNLPIQYPGLGRVVFSSSPYSYPYPLSQVRVLSRSFMVRSLGIGMMPEIHVYYAMV